MKVQEGKKVRMEYEIAIDGGDIIESSANKGPLEYLHGSGKMLAGLETRIAGMGVGDEAEGIIPAAEAFGNPDALPTQAISRDEFPANALLEEGMQFEARNIDGDPVQFTVIHIDDEFVTVRYEHPLANRDIRYKVKILAIEEADESESTDMAEEASQAGPTDEAGEAEEILQFEDEDSTADEAEPSEETEEPEDARETGETEPTPEKPESP